MIKVHKAQKIGSDDVPDLALTATESLSSTHRVKELNAEFDRDARIVVDALLESLPGGTIDRIVARLCRFKASSLVVRHHPAEHDA